MIKKSKKFALVAWVLSGLFVTQTFAGQNLGKDTKNRSFRNALEDTLYAYALSEDPNPINRALSKSSTYRTWLRKRDKKKLIQMIEKAELDINREFNRQMRHHDYGNARLHRTTALAFADLMLLSALVTAGYGTYFCLNEIVDLFGPSGCTFIMALTLLGYLSHS